MSFRYNKEKRLQLQIKSMRKKVLITLQKRLERGDLKHISNKIVKRERNFSYGRGEDVKSVFLLHRF